MFLAILFIVLGVILLLDALGIIVATNFWGIFWAIVFLAVGIKMLKRKNKCPICNWGQKIHWNCCGHNPNQTQGQKEE